MFSPKIRENKTRKPFNKAALPKNKAVSYKNLPVMTTSNEKLSHSTLKTYAGADIRKIHQKIKNTKNMRIFINIIIFFFCLSLSLSLPFIYLSVRMYLSLSLRRFCYHTVCPRSSDQNCKVTRCIKWVTTSWTHSISPSTS